MTNARTGLVGTCLAAALVLGACAVGTSATKGFDDGTGVNGEADGDGDGGTSKDGGVNYGGEGGACTDTTSDPANCGTCGHRCGVADAGGLTLGSDGNPDAGLTKIDGGAPWSLGAPACAKSACGVTCPAPMTLCADDVCYDTSRFHEHCGSCTTACTAAQACTAGHCCATGTSWCGSSCIDVRSDNANCGTCGHACGAAQMCSAGACITCNTNVALSAAASGSGGGTSPYGPDSMKDGKLEAAACNAFTWVNSGSSAGGAYLQYTWPAAKTLVSMHMDTSSMTGDFCTADKRTLGAATVQWWNGATWVTDGTVTAKTDDWDYTFTAPVTTTQVRLYALYTPTSGGYNAVAYEWQVAGCN